MDEEPPYDVVLDDQLQCTYVPRVSEAAKAAAANDEATRVFLNKWTERGGVHQNNNDNNNNSDGGDDDDIGAVFQTRGRRMANANRDVRRLLDRARRVYAKDPDRPDMAMGHKMVLLDRARRIAFGYVRPPPMTLAQGLDGGVNITAYQRRRRRPGEDDRDENKNKNVNNAKGGGGRGSGRPPPSGPPPPYSGIKPRHRADTGTACVGVLPDQFKVVGGGRRRGSSTAGIAISISSGQRTARANRASRLQRALAEYLLRQPAVTAVHAALRHI